MSIIMKNLGVLYVIMVMFLTVTSLSAQDRKISGKITGDDDPEGIPGVNIVIDGTDIGTVTDVDGSFSLSIPADIENPVLLVSSVSYKTQEVSVDGRSTIDVELEVFSKELDEVVVTAYNEGGTAKRSITGSISSIGAKEIEEQQIVNIAQALEGKVAGVRVITSSGQPGTVPAIYIRGVGTLSSSTQPLTVVDGAAFSINSSVLSTRDIESVSVLKDASAAVLYGSRAANGVVMYRTKRGTRYTEPRFTFSLQYGVQSRAVPQYDLPNAGEYLSLLWEASRNQKLFGLYRSNGYPTAEINGVDRPDLTQITAAQRAALYEEAGILASQEFYGGDGVGITYNPYGTLITDQGGNKEFISPFDDEGNPTEAAEENGLLWDTNWSSHLENPSPVRREAFFNVEGGSKKFRYYLSGGYFTADGVVFNSDFKRITSRANVEADPASWITAGALNTYSYNQSTVPTQGGSAFRNSVQWIRTVPSIFPLYLRTPEGEIVRDEQGEPIPDDGNSEAGVLNTGRNVLPNYTILNVTRLDDDIVDRNMISTIPYVEFRPLKGLSFRSQFGFAYYAFQSFIYRNPDYGDARNVNGRISQSRDVTQEYTFSNTLNYDLRLGIFDMDFTVGSELYRFYVSNFSAQKTNLLGKELDVAASNVGSSGSSREERIARIFGSMTYGVLNRYFLELHMSRDELSRFADDRRGSTFYSTGLSWVVSDEPWFPKSSLFDAMRFKSSYGLVGNTGIAGGDAFPYLERFSASVPQGREAGAYKFNIYDPEVTWETSNILNVGTDISLFRGKLGLRLDYFERITDDLVLDKPLPSSLGYASFFSNVASIKNTGVDIDIRSTHLNNKNFSWASSLVLGTISNEIRSLPDNNKDLTVGPTIWKVGGSRYDYWLAEWAGVDPITGLSQWYKSVPEYDENGDSKLDDSGEIIFTDRRVKTFNYDSANFRGSRIYAGNSFPVLNGGINTNMRLYNFTLSVGFSFEVGGNVLILDYSSLAHDMGKVGEQITRNYITDGWKEVGDESELPLLTLDASGLIAESSTRFFYNNSYARLRTLSLSYAVPSRLLQRTKYIKGVNLFLQGDNIYTFFLSQKNKRPPIGFDPQVAGLGGLASGNASSALRTVTTGISVSF